MKSCGMSFIKYLLFIFNLVFAISGISLIVASAVVLADVSEYSHFADGLIELPIVLIVAGAIVFVVAFLGCFGAIKESYNMLIAFAGLLLVIFITELAVGIAAAVYKAEFQNALHDSLMKSIQNYSIEPKKITWDNLQTKFMCCGVDGPNDWETHSQLIPLSCCHGDAADGLSSDLYPHCVNNGIGKYLFQTGCYEKLKIQVESNAKILIGVGIGIAFIEIVGIVLACWLAYRIKKEGTSK